MKGNFHYDFCSRRAESQEIGLTWALSKVSPRVLGCSTQLLNSVDQWSSRYPFIWFPISHNKSPR